MSRTGADTEALVRYLVESLVDVPEAVKISVTQSDRLRQLHGGARPLRRRQGHRARRAHHQGHPHSGPRCRQHREPAGRGRRRRLTCPWQQSPTPRSGASPRPTDSTGRSPSSSTTGPLLSFGRDCSCGSCHPPGRQDRRGSSRLGQDPRGRSCRSSDVTTVDQAAPLVGCSILARAEDLPGERQNADER